MCTTCVNILLRDFHIPFGCAAKTCLEASGACFWWEGAPLGPEAHLFLRPLLSQPHQPTQLLAPAGAVAVAALVAQSCPTLCDPMNRNTPGLPVHHQLPKFTETHVHRVSDAIQPSHPLSSPSPPAPNPSQHQSLFQ